MKTVAILCFVVIANLKVSAQSVSAADILRANLGTTSGTIVTEPSITCELQIDDKTIPGRLVVAAGIFANVTLMIFPADFWDLDLLSHALTYYAGDRTADSVSFFYDPNNLKINTFSYNHQSGTGLGGSCKLRN